MIEGLSDMIQSLLGLGRSVEEIGSGQMALRSVVVYVVTLAVVRLGSKRFLGKATAFDVIIGIMIGSVMSRGINGGAGLAPTLAAGSVLVALHWLFAVLSYHTGWFGTLVKGKPVKLIEDGRVRNEAMRGSSLSENDLNEALRLGGITPDPSRVRLAYLERNGSISVITRKPDPQILDVAVSEDGVQTVRIQLE